jgi:catechol 2,3-dioxygenase-like lactoylglutathione lyase family enzyme
MKFRRFEHINQTCQDLQKTRDFYETLFPDWQVRAQGEEDGWIWQHFGDHQFYLALNQPPAGTEVSPTTGHLEHIGFVIDDGAAMQLLLDAHNIEYVVFNSPETKYRIYVNDPDGTEVELVEYQNDYLLR